MTLPREFSLTSIEDEYHLTNFPSPDFLAISDAHMTYTSKLNKLQTLAISDCCEIDLLFAGITRDNIIKTELKNSCFESLTLSLDIANKEARLDRGNCRWSTKNFHSVMKGPLRMFTQTEIKVKIIVDVSTIEVFINNGLTTFTAIFFVETPISSLCLSGKNVDEVNLSATVNFLG